VRRLLCAALVVATSVAGLYVGMNPASAATSITAPTGNPYVVPGNAGGDPLPFNVAASGFAAGGNVYIEQCDGTLPTAVGWDPTTNCDLGSSPAPAVADGSGNVSFPSADPNFAFHPFKGSSPQGIFNCLSPNDPSPANGLPDFRNCQIRVSSNNSAATADQVFLRIQLPDDDTTVPPAPLKVGISDTGVLEGNSGTRPVTFTISLSRAALSPVTVHYATVNGTATAPSDFTAKSGTLTIPAGLISVTQAISVKGDTVKELAETFKVVLSAPTGATINRANGFAQILNDDPPKAGVRMGIGNASVLEGDAARRSLRFTVSISQPTTQSVTVHYATTADTATAPSDFEARTGTLTIPAGKTSALILILIKGDETNELTESFTVKLSSPVRAVIDRATGTGRITNDD
jgi:hypothetical protein